MKCLKSFFLRKKTLGVQRKQKTISKGTTISEPSRVEGYLQNTFFSTDVLIEQSITVTVFSLKKFGIRNSIKKGIFKGHSVYITWMLRNYIRWYYQHLGSYPATVPFLEQGKPTFSISLSVLPLAPRTTIPKAAERLSGEKKIFSFLFLLLSSLKKSRQNLALAALREHIVVLQSPAIRETKI